MFNRMTDAPNDAQVDDGPLLRRSSRRSLLRWSLGGGAALAGATLTRGLATGAAQGHGAHLTFEVAPDLSTFDAARAPVGGNPFPTGPFYVQGPIYRPETLTADGAAPSDAEVVGTFRCWGWLFDPVSFGAAVSQSYEIFGLGDIQTQGREGADVRTITGGTDAFRSLRGGAQVTFINPANFSFRIDFGVR